MAIVNMVAPFKIPDVSMEFFYKEGLEILGHEVFVQPTLKKDADLTIVIKGTHRPEELPNPVLIWTDNYDRGEVYLDSLVAGDVYSHIFLPNIDPEIYQYECFHWLPCAYSPRHHYRLDRVRNMSCLFIGTMHPNREWIMKIPGVSIYGNEWPMNISAKYGRDKMELHARSKIILNQHWNQFGFNMRFAETLASGGFMLSDCVVGPEMRGFEPGIHFIEYSSPNEVPDLIEYYLENEAERAKIAEAGHEAILCGGHAYSDRMKELLKEVGL